jgi:hypothetical protein
MSDADRRDSYRFDLRDGGVVVRTPEGLALEVLDLSASGSGLLAPRALLGQIQGLTTIVELGDRRFSTSLDVIRASTDRRGLMRIGTRFRDLDRPALQHLSAFLIDEFARRSRKVSRLYEGKMPALINRDRGVIRRVLTLHAIDLAKPLRVYTEELLPTQLRAQPSKHAFGQEFLAEAVGDPAVLEVGSAYTFVVAGAGAIYVFSSRILDREGKVFKISAPDEIQQRAFRDSFRTTLSESGREAGVRFPHPVLADVEIQRTIREVAGRGFSFLIDPQKDILFPGSRIERLELTGGDQAIVGTGIVRNLSQSENPGLCVCGIEILGFSSREHADAWHNLVLSTVHEHVRLKDRNAVGKAWIILNSSEYVTLWTHRRHKAYLARQFADAWLGMDEQFGSILLVNNEIRTIGTVAANLLYPKTWIVHHLGIDREERTPGQKEQFLMLTRELYSAALFLLMHKAHPKYFVLYVEKSKRWNERLYGDFVTNYSTTADFIYSDIQVYKKRFDPEAPVPVENAHRSAGVLVVEEDADLLSRLAARLQTSLPRLEVEAFSYGADELDLGTFAVRCAKEGYERGRRVFFALDGEEPIAALIAENGSEGVNVFGLLNTCRLFDMSESHPALGEARTLLIEKAAAHYRGLGKREFLLLDEGNEIKQPILDAGLTLASPGVRWLVSRDVVPAWLNYIDDLFRSKL